MWRSNISRVFVYMGLTACLLTLSASPVTSSRLAKVGLEQQQPPPGQPRFYEAYFRFQGTYPNEEETAYSLEFQGLTHDDSNWFIANNAVVDPRITPLFPLVEYPGIWKIPVLQDLRHVNSPYPPGEVPAEKKWVYKPLLEEPDIADARYNHIGDISYYESSDIGYVVAPLEKTGGPHAIALFKGDDLEYIGRAEVGDPGDGPSQADKPKPHDLGWVAVDPKGYIYTSSDFTTHIYQYQLNWEELPFKKPELTCIDRIQLFDQSGYPLDLYNIQGGVFSERGGLLYLVTGVEYKRYPSDGINVFDTQTWRRVAKSTGADEQPSDFHYHYRPGWTEWEEPEGITIWDLDGKGAPGVSGQLHVGLLNNVPDDEVYIYHYGMLYTDGAHMGPEVGDFASPFNTVGEAYARAWDGAQIKIRPSVYLEALTLSKRVELRALGGKVTIGPSIATTPLTPSSTTSIQSPLATRLDSTGDYVKTNEYLFELLARSSAANTYKVADIRARLRAGEGLVIFFEDEDYVDSYRAFWSGGGGLCDPLSRDTHMNFSDGGKWEEADSFLFFAPENSHLVLHIYDGELFEGTNIRFRGPAAVADMNDLDDKFGMGGDEMESFKFEDWY